MVYFPTRNVIGKTKAFYLAKNLGSYGCGVAEAKARLTVHCSFIDNDKRWRSLSRGTMAQRRNHDDATLNEDSLLCDNKMFEAGEQRLGVRAQRKTKPL